LTGAGTLDGYQGTSTGLTTGFDNINLLTGSVNSDTLIGTTGDDTFRMTGTNAGPSTTSSASPRSRT